MRFDYEFAIVEYKKVEKYLNKYGYRCEPTGSIRRKKKEVGDVDIVVGEKEGKNLRVENLKEIEMSVLELVSKYSQVKKRINHYEFLLESGISIHMIPETSKHFSYTLWHSTGPKPHVELIKKIYREKEIEIDMVDTIEDDIYINIGLRYLKPENRWELV